MRSTIIFAVTLLQAVAVFASDGWTGSGTDPEYPKTLYFVGVGMSERGVNEARNNAVVEVKKQISVNINATVLDEQMSMISDGIEVASQNRTKSTARLTTQGAVQGIEVARTTQKDGVYYALAVLDKENFAANCKTLIQENKAELERMMSTARKAIANAQVQDALRALAAARHALKTVVEQRTLLSAAQPLTQQQQLNYTKTDIDQLYEQSIAGITMTKISGDRQEVVAGNPPPYPFVVEVTINSTPAPMIPVYLKNESGKVVVVEYTRANGRANLVPDDAADMSAGVHRYTASIGLKVSSSVKTMLTAQEISFKYTVTTSPVYVNISVALSPNVSSDKSGIVKKVVKRLGKYNLMHDGAACFSLLADISVEEKGHVQGVSAARTFVSSIVDATFTLKDGKGRTLSTFGKTAKGTGSTLGKSAQQAIGNLKIKESAALAVEAMEKAGDQECGSPQPQASTPRPAGPSPKTAAAPPSGDGSNPEEAIYLPIDNQWHKGTYIQSEKWYYTDVAANASYYLYTDHVFNGSGKYTAGRVKIKIFRENLIDQLQATGGGHYMTAPYTINAVATERIYINCLGNWKDVNTTFALKLKNK